MQTNNQSLNLSNILKRLFVLLILCLATNTWADDDSQCVSEQCCLMERNPITGETIYQCPFFKVPKTEHCTFASAMKKALANQSL